MYRDIDIFQEGGEARSPDLGSIEPLSPLEQQRIFNPTLYQRAIDYLTTQGFTPEQERARTFARGISSLIPGVSTDIAKAEKDILGEGLSLLDLVPVAGPVAKQAVKSGADTIKGFHASSKNFDKFRFPKAEDLTGAKQGGGGFGMQKEGVGLYFTTYPELASAYKTQITDRTRRKGKLYEADIKISEDEMLKNSVRFDQQKPAVLKKLEDSGILQDVKKAETRRLQKQAKLVEKNKKKYEKFKSDLENKKIPNSSANRDKLDDLETDFDLAEYYLSDEGLDDASLLYPYNYLSPHLKGAEQVRIPGSPRAKAQKLSKAGIKGNFYGITGRDMFDDFGARGILSPDVPKEFVIFDPKRIEITKKYQEGGEVSPDLGTIEPLMPGEVGGGFVDYLTRPMVPSPARQRRDFVRGIASFVPGLSYEIAKAEKDPLGQGLSLLDLIPGGAVVGAPLKKAAKEGIESLEGGLDKNANLMYETAKEANPVFQNEISKIAQKTGLELGVPDARLLDTNQLLKSLDPETGQIAGTVKKVPRIMEKAVTKYDGDVSKITDVIRTRVIVKTPQDEEKILKLLSENFEVLDKGRLVKPTGFVDRKILVKSDSFTETPTTIIGEIALITEPMIQASKKSHPIYKKFRTLFPKGMPTNKKELGKIGDEIRQQGLDLDRQMKELFDEAKKEIDSGFYDVVSPSKKGIASLDVASKDLLEEFNLRGGAKVDSQNNVTLYHRTNKDSADKIKQTGKMIGKEDRLYFSTKPSGAIKGYGDELVEVKIPIQNLNIEDIFSDEVHVTLKSNFKPTDVDVKKFASGGYVTSGKSGNSAPIAPNLFSNAPLDIFEPSTKKSAIMSGDAKVQSVLPEDIKKPYDPSSTESITAGPSSHVKNNLSINSILQEVTKNYKPDQINIFDVE
jgi:hypothetical protein